MQQINLKRAPGTPLNILLYGQPGTGKSRCIGSAGALFHTLILDMEIGSATLHYIKPEWRDNLVVVRPDKFNEIDKIYQALKINTPEAFAKLGILTDKPFQCCAVDTLSELQNLAKTSIRNLNEFSIIQDIRTMAALQIQDWGKIVDFTELTVKAFKLLPVHFICSTHEKVIEDKLTSVISGMPSLSGKIASDIGKHFDIVGRMLVNDKKYALNTRAHARFQAKSRIPCPEQIIDPTIEKLVQELKKAEDLTNV